MNLKRFLPSPFKRAAVAKDVPPHAAEIRKAAVLIACIDRATAEALLERMPAGQAQRVRWAADALGEIDPAEQAAVMQAFAAAEVSQPQRTHEPGPDNRPPKQSAPAVELQLSSQATSHAAHEAPPSPHFRLLRAASGEKLRPLLEGEHPQTIALVISHLPAERAADMLATLGGELQVEVVRRLVNLEQANPEVLLEVERGLESRMLEQSLDEHRQTAGMASVAGILAAASPQAKREILANLSRHDRHLAGRLVEREFRFSDLEQISGRSLALVLETAGMELTVLALAGAGPTLHERMLAAVPADTAAMLTGALEGLGPTRLSDVEEAQHELARVARQLEAEGRIDLSGAVVAMVA
jgi:flagellar motor switch protein FliG